MQPHADVFARLLALIYRTFVVVSPETYVADVRSLGCNRRTLSTCSSAPVLLYRSVVVVVVVVVCVCVCVCVCVLVCVCVCVCVCVWCREG
jgi:hypothetical protein